MNSKLLIFTFLIISIFQAQAQMAPCYDNEEECLIDAVSTNECPMANMEYGCQKVAAKWSQCCLKVCQNCINCLNNFGCCQSGDYATQMDACMTNCQNNAPLKPSGDAEC